MRRISTSMVVVLSTLLLISISSAQQTSGNKQNNPKQDASPIGIEGPVIGGDGTANYIPIWRTPNYLLSSAIYQESGGNIGIGTTTPAATLDVNGGINTATTYQIGGSSVLNIGSSADGNLFLGVAAGANNVAGRGTRNTFSGYQAGASNTIGTENTFVGESAGAGNSSGGGNAYLGDGAGYAGTTATGETCLGSNACGAAQNTGFYNTVVGFGAGYVNTTGQSNSWIGAGAGTNNTSGSFNVSLGYSAGSGNTTGSYNVWLGELGGPSNFTGSGNIYIQAIAAGSTESNTIRIGDTTGRLPIKATYIEGIYFATASSGVPVYINSNGQLGTQTSSLRFKEQVRDMGDSTSALLKLRPVTFFYKPQYDDGSHALQYGLIAEEVAQVYPDMVAYDKDGAPYTVKYQFLAPMLLNELQKQHAVIAGQQDAMKSQQQEIKSLKQQLQQQSAMLQDRLTRLEGLVRTQMQSVAQEK